MNMPNRKVTSACLDASFEVNTRKPQQPHWEHGEIMVFIKAKRNKHVIYNLGQS
jgi:hypothetical protein